MKKISKRLKKETVDLDITAFLNLMIILIPFLLITTVFSRITILEINTPFENTMANKEKPKVKLQLEIVLTKNNFSIQDSNLGILKNISRTKGSLYYENLNKFLQDIKSRFPNEKSITLFVDKDVEYKTLIHVMDSVRIFTNKNKQQSELFPEISISDNYQI